MTSTRLKAMCGLCASMAPRMVDRSSETPIATTSWPSSCSASRTSNSVLRNSRCFSLKPLRSPTGISFSSASMMTRSFRLGWYLGLEVHTTPKSSRSMTTERGTPISHRSTGTYASVEINTLGRTSHWLNIRPRILFPKHNRHKSGRHFGGRGLLISSPKNPNKALRRNGDG